MADEPQEKRTSDLHLAAFVFSLGYPVLKVSGSKMRQEFVFKVPESVILSFYSDTPNVSARKLFNALRDLRGYLAQNFSGEGLR